MKEEIERKEVEESEQKQLKAISPPTTLESKLIRGGLLSFHFSSFIFESPKYHFSLQEIAMPSLKMIKPSIHGNSQLGLGLLLWVPLTQETNKISKEERFLHSIKLEHFKIKKPSSTHVLLYVLLGHRKLISDMFNAYYRWIFDPGGILVKSTKISPQANHQI